MKDKGREKGCRELKRSGKKGRFEFRVTEQKDNIKRITISAVNEDDPSRSSHIIMTKSEFEMVADALIKLQNLVSSPQSLKSGVLNVTSSAVPIEEDPVPLSLDGGVPKITEESAMEKTLDAIDAGLASLDALDEDRESSPASELVGHDASAAAVQTLVKPQKRLIAPTVPVSPPTPEPISVISDDDNDNEDNEDKLDPTEWDPW